MKKQLLLFTTYLVLTIAVKAQITLTQSNTLFTAGSMTVIEGDTTAFILPTQAANQQWNYSNLIQKTSSILNYIPSANTNFPLATFIDTAGTSPIIPNKYYYLDTYYQTSSVGTKALGYVIKNQKYPIGGLTLNNADSIIFPNQFFTYTSNSYLMPFPCTMSTSWKTTTRSVSNFTLTITNYSIINAPCQKVTNTTRQDTVVGWGKLRVPTALGPSIAYDVLMVKRNVIQKDSFYMYGSEADPALLNAFGLSQNQTTITNRFMFWRENARYPLLLLNFGSDNFSKISSVFYDGTAQFDPSSVDMINQNNDINIYPNPNNGVFYLQISNKNDAFDIKIYNLLGQIVFAKSYNSAYNDIIELDVAFLKKGSYIVRYNSKTKLLNSKLVIN
ncbi:MAG: T9SS type A sorting domain-containing protein [Bacteroidetes bacterium]|nr:T9SS type A sorting domain-containing protein [Bacteroidota bacterium]